MGPPSIPTVELEGPTGRRVTVAPRSPDDRMGELADALGLDPRRRIELDGRPVGRHETLRRAGLTRGSRLSTAPPGEPTRSGEADPSATPAPVVVVVGEAGPASGTAVTLPAGRFVVGRSPAVPVSIADPALEPHHGLLHVDADGTVQFLQLTGRVPARVAGEPVHGAALVPDGATIVVGASRLRVGRSVGSVPTAAAVTVTLGGPVAAIAASHAPGAAALGSATGPSPGAMRPESVAERPRRDGRDLHPDRFGRHRRRHALAALPVARRRRRAGVVGHVDRRPHRFVARPPAGCGATGP